MPDQPKTPARSLRVEENLWYASLAEAERRGESLSAAIRRFLTKQYTKGKG